MGLILTQEKPCRIQRYTSSLWVSEQKCIAPVQDTGILVLILCFERLIVPVGWHKGEGNAHLQTPDAMFAAVPSAFMGLQSSTQAKQCHFCSSNIPDPSSRAGKEFSEVQLVYCDIL